VRYGSDGVELLVKLIDAGQRLPVHVHPARSWAREHLGLAHGKTEAWVIVDAEPGAVVGLGLRAPMSHEELLGLVRAHDSAALVDAVHTRPALPGGGVFVPAGTPHFIGEGILVVEVQEPTDLSILLEWDGFAVDGDRDGHLGVGFEAAVTAVDTTVWSASDVDACLRSLPTGATGLVPALVDDAEPYFRAQWVAPGGPSAETVDVAAGFAVLVVLDGAGAVQAGEHRLELGRGDVAVLPYAAGEWRLRGDVRGVLCRPPAPDAPPAPR
jgi:mannose-6-phosphate isomerase